MPIHYFALLAALASTGVQLAVFLRWLHRRMRDDEIMRTLRDADRMPFSSYVVVLGLLCILVSIGWRLARYFL